jgi:hypothetical protein
MVCKVESVHSETMDMPDKPGRIEHYERQFGIIAIEKGFIKSDNLIDALKIQVKEDIEYKTHRLIGEILMENGCLSPYQIQEILEAIFKR